MSIAAQRPLGTSGLTVSAAALGCNNLGRTGTATATLEGVRELVAAALDAGITFFDVADVYGAEPGLSERLLGQALQDLGARPVVATKFGMKLAGLGEEYGPRGSRAYIRWAVENSLQRLQIDVIDLYQYHQHDRVTPIEETTEALQELVAEGKIRAFGHSNFAGWMIARADAAARSAGGPTWVTAQDKYSLLDRVVESEVLPSSRAHGVSLIPYFPLENGLLTGKYSGGNRPEASRLVREKPHLLEKANWEQLDRFSAFAKERGASEIAVAIGWLLAQQNVDTVIAGATKPEQVRQNAAEALAWQPSEADLAELDSIFPAVGPYGGFRPS